MANKEYYQFWLKSKDYLKKTIDEDVRLQELAKTFIGIKPQSVAVEIVARVYCKYCELFNKLCECYDQMTQVQRRPYVRALIDAITCRILELKATFENVEAFEFTYPENALQQMFMVPQDIQVICPFFYPFEIREKEQQYIIDEIMSGNRIGDPSPTPSEIERREEERLEEERKLQEEKDAEIKRKLAMGEDISLSEDAVVLSPEELEQIRLKEEFDMHIHAIQRMERSRIIIREKAHKLNKDTNLYLELAGLKAPQAPDHLKLKAAKLIQFVYRRFMEIKREKLKENKLREKLDMIIPSCQHFLMKENWEKVKQCRRKYRQNYYEKWLKENLKEKDRVMRLREGNIMEDISDEVRQWLQEWYKAVRLFDEYPWPEEGGSILIVRGETFTIEEFIDWRTKEEKRLKEEASSPKSKEDIKAEKIAAREEKKRLEAEAREREKKRILEYKKSRLNPDSDPGVYINIGKNIEPLLEAWTTYENLWKFFDQRTPKAEVLSGFIYEIITENAYEECQIQLRPIVDEMMRLELIMLKNALKEDCLQAGIAKPPQSKKRKKPKKVKPPKPEKLTPAFMFQQLVDEGIIKKYPHTTFDDYWGDQNYAAADMRAIPWIPKFPPPTIGDARELVRTRCLLTLGCNCSDAIRTHLIVGPASAGKRTLIYAIATETNSILIDLSPMNIYNKFPGPKNLKYLFQLVNKVSRFMQPTIIMIENAEKTFYKKVPKEEKMFDPSRLQKDFFKELVKPLTGNDKVLIIGTSSEPWLAKASNLQKAFQSTILLPRSDYGSISYILTKTLMKYHGVSRYFDVHSIAQALRGYDVKSIKKAMEVVLNGKRIAALGHTPLKQEEILYALLELEDNIYTSEEDYKLFEEWYLSYSPFGEKFLDYRLMLDCQLEFKIKNEKKKKGG